jgi:endo-1,4-beta-xylanase
MFRSLAVRSGVTVLLAATVLSAHPSTIRQAPKMERPQVPAAPAVQDDAVITGGIADRIRRHRTAPLRVLVTDLEGRPLAGREVRVEHRRHLFRFGAALHGDIAARAGETDADRRHREAFLRVFNAATVTFYWARYEPERGAWRDEERLRRIAWLQDRDIVVRGHPLFWNHEQACVPSWLRAGTWTRSDLLALMDRTLDHASQTLLPRLRDVDVFNELVEWERNVKSPLTPALSGGDKVPTVTKYLKAFKARNPGVLSVVNDYHQSPRYADLLRSLLEAGAPIDEIGQQSHMHAREWTPAEAWAVVERLAAFGRPVLFTELSVISGPRRKEVNFQDRIAEWETSPAYEQEQAIYLEQFYRLLYSHPSVQQITLWNYSDRGAWLGAPVGIIREDGTPKPAFDRLDRLINEEWATRGTFTTNARGEVLVDGAFEGEYRVSAGTGAIDAPHHAAQPLTARISSR